MNKPYPQEFPTVDVCLLLEGTYPFVRGGVSTWVHQVINAMPDISFGILYIGADPETSGEPKYELPSNLLWMERCFLFSPPPVGTGRGHDGADCGPLVKELCESFRGGFHAMQGCGEVPVEVVARILETAFELSGRLSFEDFWRDSTVWDTLREFCLRCYPQESFVDFFWNSRFLVEPLWKAFQAGVELPPARVFHSVSTGYAGIVAALAARRADRPFLLSEHGIYIRERIADLLRSEWAPARKRHSRTSIGGVGVLRHLWIELFVQLGRMTYGSSSVIVSLFQRNADYQVEFGAEPERIRIIPNGVPLEGFDTATEERRRRRAADPARQQVGFLGRVVSIKDVRTLIRAARLVCAALPGARFLIIGPTDEDEDYANGCRELISELGLEDRVAMPGPMKMEEALPEFDVMVLSSVSEGLPFSVLESFAVELPVVSTDVGACSELILGSPRENPRLGPSGFIVPVGDDVALADALVALLTDRELQDRCGKAGKARTRAYYEEGEVMEAYRTLYRGLPDPAELALNRERNS